MKYAILFVPIHQYYFATDKDNKRIEFDTFGKAYVHAVALGCSSPFEIIGVFDPKDISVTVCER
ncbi:MAG: hypothetical protein WC455_10360 [Dehalococcoidia bacterium]|jgi:hypothetical protein